MTSAAPWIALCSGVVLIGAAAVLARRIDRTRRVEARLWTEPSVSETPRSSIGQWLVLAGFDGSAAPRQFWVRQAVATILGFALAALWTASGMSAELSQQVFAIPVFGAALAWVAAALPFFIFVLSAAAPTLHVRAARRARVASLERDLPSALETLATLAESGLGFESALDRFVANSPPRPLVRELSRVQNEIRAGEARALAMRRLSERTDLPPIRGFVSAWIQAEESGAGLTEILRVIADDLARRSRERALARAEALPEKLVFPLIVGFLPGILVWTLGPAIHRLVTLIDAVMASPR